MEYSVLVIGFIVYENDVLVFVINVFVEVIKCDFSISLDWN